MGEIVSYVTRNPGVNQELRFAIEHPDPSRIVQRIFDWFLIGQLAGRKLTIKVFSQDGTKSVGKPVEIDVEPGLLKTLDPWEQFLPEFDALVKTCAALWKAAP